MLYVKAENTIYRIMKEEILFYNNFVGYLTSIGFKLNPYDPHVTNKLINVKKITVVWHVDDIKFIHESKNIVTVMKNT